MEARQDTNRTYAGIGSRATPATVLTAMTAAARRLQQRGYTLRSGAARGADSAFEDGAGAAKEIWVPWRGFNQHPSLRTPTIEALSLASRVHPAWHKCSSPAQKMHARNMHQVLGEDLDDSVDFVLCFTPDGSGAGGTGQAIRLARLCAIPVFDLGAGQDAALKAVAEHLAKPRVFVFGSNLRGLHGAGAARYAARVYDAREGVGEGRTEQAYALPTKDKAIQTLPLEKVKQAIARFLQHARQEPKTLFFVTRIGCGLAGYRDEDIAPFFRQAPENCLIAPRWRLHNHSKNKEIKES